MRVYLSAAMTNKSRDIGVISVLVSHIEASGHEVPTRHVADPDGRSRDADLTDAQLAKRDLTWIAASEVLVAEVSTPSHGVGVEVLAATQRGIPVLLLHAHNVAVSRLLLGLPGTEVYSYRSLHEACAAVDDFLARLAPTGQQTR
jgi:hypothetical protein